MLETHEVASFTLYNLLVGTITEEDLCIAASASFSILRNRTSQVGMSLISPITGPAVQTP